jgi:hypothetical protein
VTSDEEEKPLYGLSTGRNESHSISQFCPAKYAKGVTETISLHSIDRSGKLENINLQ